MAKKRPGKHKPKGWPRRRAASPQDGKLDAMEAIAQRVANGTLSEEEFRRYAERLRHILIHWPEISQARPDTQELSEAIQELPAEERDTLLGRSQSVRRTRRACAKLFPRIFDEEMMADLSASLRDAMRRAGSPDDYGALALAFYGLSVGPENPASPGNNALLGLVTDVTILEMAQMAQAIDEVKQAHESTADSTADPAERERQLRDAMHQHPVLQAAMHRRFGRRLKRLNHYIATGTIDAHLAAEDLEPLLDRMRQAVRGELDAHPGDPRQMLGRSPDFGTMLRDFAEDPANAPMFERLLNALHAQATQAQADGHPNASRLGELAQICREMPPKIANLILCEGSFLRLQREGRLRLFDEAGNTPSPGPADEAEGQMDAGGGEAPPPGSDPGSEHRDAT